MLSSGIPRDHIDLSMWQHSFAFYGCAESGGMALVRSALRCHFWGVEGEKISLHLIVLLCVQAAVHNRGTKHGAGRAQ